MFSEQIQKFQYFRGKNVSLKVKNRTSPSLKKHSFGKTTGGGQIDSQPFYG